MRLTVTLRGLAAVAGVLPGLCLPGRCLPAADAYAGPDSRTIACTPDRAARLNDAIRAADAQPDTVWDIALEGGCTYTVTEPFGGLNGLDAVTGRVRIGSLGPADATIARSDAPGTARFRVLEVEVGGDLTLSGITVRNGRLGSGAGIFNNFGTLTLHGSAVTGNQASETAGGIFNSGNAESRDSRVVGNAPDNCGRSPSPVPGCGD